MHIRGATRTTEKAVLGTTRKDRSKCGCISVGNLPFVGNAFEDSLEGEVVALDSAQPPMGFRRNPDDNDAQQACSTEKLV